MEAAVRKLSVSYDTVPTHEQFNAYQNMFEYYNFKLFGGKLPNIILNFSRKKQNCGGFFAPERWLAGDEKLHEISLNPDGYAKDEKLLVSILVHEMAHLWQEVFGKPSRTGYHNKEWGNKMKEIGLYPSNTGKPGGKEIGQQMTHYVIERGAFELAFDVMPAEYLLPFKFAPAPLKLIKTKNKVKYICPVCDAKVWGKPDMHVRCNECDSDFDEA